jgi:hypothetical protein
MARSAPPHLVLLDNEAVQALADPRHRKHRTALAVFEVVAQRKQRGAVVDTAVPTSVRVEAGWDRTAPGAAFVNLLRIRDIALDAQLADRAVSVRERAGVSVADAHLGAAIATADVERISVLTSDPDDLVAVAGDTAVTVVPL